MRAGKCIFLTLREDGFEQEQKAKEGSSSSSSTSSTSSALSSPQSSNNLALAAGSIPKSLSPGSPLSSRRRPKPSSGSPTNESCKKTPGSRFAERFRRREQSLPETFEFRHPNAVSSSLPTNVPASAFKHPPLLQQQQKPPATTAITPRSGASFLQLEAPKRRELHVAWLNRATGELQSRIEKESLLDSSSSAICSALRTAMEAIEEARRQIEALESPPPATIEGSKLANNLGSSSNSGSGGVINTGRSRSQEYDRTTVEGAGISPPLPPSISPINVAPIDDESVGEEAGPESSSTSPTGGAGSSPKESSGIEAPSGAIAAALANKHLAQLPPPLVPISPPVVAKFVPASPDS